MTDSTSILRTRIDEFLQQLVKLQSGLQTILQSGPGEDAPDLSTLQDQCRSLQPQFQKILSLAAETPLPPGTESQIRPYLTESNRLVRLIALDAAFLKTARQAQTLQARLAQIGERLSQLQTLCQAGQTALG
ncbi:heterocyst frequency control protein PatD [Romeria aff. gracilis LEGE 07310]|uniref:Heterocyst frequency control protein PatD n=1 Tax=Vasconcelosia minhoensis LEGE 07310 TaxID=915328 RepID=A0A8J7AZ99_9CYAN|nr:heterocyst frequency control protein PatD [Romeria gracilis]MBE9079122.1 heterocyst frequency control protein PatD [Romeria aff. gracilis LEGE 07310]